MQHTKSAATLRQKFLSALMHLHRLPIFVAQLFVAQASACGF
jgi:hypothetical protein